MNGRLLFQSGQFGSGWRQRHVAEFIDDQQPVASEMTLEPDSGAAEPIGRFSEGLLLRLLQMRVGA
jgi:hypothetical protein